jgi:hypothetical protein
MNTIPQARIDLRDIPWTSCECGGLTFTSGVMFKRLSPIISPDGQEHMVPVEIFTCDICKKIPSFVSLKVPGLPETVKAKNESGLI